MKKLLALTLLGSVQLFAEPVCHMCEVIREHNKEHPGDYEYYDDYLKAEKEKNDVSSKEKKQDDGVSPR